MFMIKGGAERVISTLSNGEFGRKNEIYILTVIKGKPEYKLNDKVKHKGITTEDDYFGKGKVKTLPAVCRGYYRMVKKLQPDVILCFLPEPCFIAGLYRDILKIPVIGSERGNPYYQFGNPVYKFLGNWLYGKADGFVFQTQGAKEFFNKKVRENSVIIGNPVTHEELPVVAMSERKKEIVAVGRFTAEKNYPLLFRAWKEVFKKHPDFRLRIYGKYEKDSDEVKLIDRLGLSESIILAGPTDDIRQKINDAYAFVLTSFSEGLPNALMEAMSIGLPVVATDCPSGGPGQLIKDGVNGLLVENRNEKAVADGINKLIDAPELAERLGRNARETGDVYAEDKIADAWIRYVESIGNL